MTQKIRTAMILTNEYLKEQARKYAFDKCETTNDAYWPLYDWFMRDWKPYVGMGLQEAKRKMRARSMAQTETLERIRQGIMQDRWSEEYQERVNHGRFML